MQPLTRLYFIVLSQARHSFIPLPLSLVSHCYSRCLFWPLRKSRTCSINGECIVDGSHQDKCLSHSLSILIYLYGRLQPSTEVVVREDLVEAEPVLRLRRTKNSLLIHSDSFFLLLLF